MKIHRDGSGSTQRVFWPVFLPNWLPPVHFTLAQPGQPAAAVEVGRTQPVPSPAGALRKRALWLPKCTLLPPPMGGRGKLLTLETYDFSNHQSSTRMGKDRKILNKTMMKKSGQGMTAGFRQGSQST